MTTVTNPPELAIWILIIALLIIVVLIALDTLIRAKKHKNPQLKIALLILLVFFTFFILWLFGIIDIPY